MQQIAIPPGKTVRADMYAQSLPDYQIFQITWPAPVGGASFPVGPVEPHTFVGVSFYTNNSQEIQWGSVVVQHSANPGSVLFQESQYLSRATPMSDIYSEVEDNHDYNDGQIILTYS
ncbi:MAG: hypothetical protein O7H41_20380 [Planctomycetota bacterium]|nr:hypothetical protein [Planctomycetota bacterium]